MCDYNEELDMDLEETMDEFDVEWNRRFGDTVGKPMTIEQSNKLMSEITFRVKGKTSYIEAIRKRNKDIYIENPKGRKSNIRE